MQHLQEPSFIPEFARLVLLVNGRRPDLAEREVRQALRQAPDSGALHGLLAMTLVKQEREKEAFQAAREGLRLEPDHPWTNQAWAAVHALLPRFRHRRGTVPAVREALRRSPFEPTLHGYLALAILNRGLARPWARGRFQEALQVAEAGLSLYPDHLDCHLVRAQALARLGRVDEAREAALRALALAPEESAAHAVLGAVEVAARNEEQGKSILREALRLDPNNRFAEEKLGVSGENQRWFAAMELQLRAWSGPMRLVRGIGVLAVALGVATGSLVPVLCGPIYVLALHPAAWNRLSRPESRALLRTPGALRRADVLNARGTIAFCVAAVMMMLVLAVWA